MLQQEIETMLEVKTLEFYSPCRVLLSNGQAPGSTCVPVASEPNQMLKGHLCNNIVCNTQ